ncbi:MAG TPA: hypothetical protein VM533_03640 [Fimbriiglobus sp.]|nr:hypothetical protein [Fimbriiglobus sp.]
MILAAVLGVVGGVGAASAQAPQQMPTAPGGVPAVAAPVVVAPVQPAPTLAAPHAVAPAPIAGGDCGGCDNACDSAKGRKHGRNGGGLFHKASIGEGCANPIGCGSCASEKTFLFGGCNQFFNPGNKCGNGLGGGCGGSSGCGLLDRIRGNCAIAPVGTGGLNQPPCTYFSYLNR